MTGEIYIVKVIYRSGASTITVVPPSGTIDGDASVVLAAWGVLRVFSNGTQWYKV